MSTTTPEALNTSTSHCPTPHVERFMAPGLYSLATYDNTKPFNQQPDQSIPDWFLDVMAVREEVYVRELGQPLEGQFRAVVDEVIYLTDWVDVSNPVARIQPGMVPVVDNDQGDVVPAKRVFKRTPVGCPAEDLTRYPPYTQIRVNQNHFILSPTTVVHQYRDRKWADNILINAVKKYLSYPNVPPDYREYAHLLREQEINDLFKAVRPLLIDPQTADDPTPQGSASARDEEPEFGGLLYVLADRTEKRFWHRTVWFRADRPAAVWKGLPFVGMYKWFRNDPTKQAARERARVQSREKSAAWAREKARAEMMMANRVAGNKRMFGQMKGEDAGMGDGDGDVEEMGEREERQRESEEEVEVILQAPIEKERRGLDDDDDPWAYLM
ncbi:hypothetical protein VP1G_08178 [Cytospora mali]|uniref:Uncharacterized protein n=1 Tax=Cytospora mali TaxID=578113 RepID=A0A194VB51_CYTMA|nr:hypothetical protein VP1G_08178 [Valsa mali var. pyri (nom. inval.)]